MNNRGSHTRFGYHGLFVPAALLLSMFTGAPRMQAQNPAVNGPRRTNQSDDPFLSTPIPSFSALLEMSKPSSPVFPKRIAQKIETGGLSFEITADQVRELKKAGAGEPIIAALEKLIAEREERERKEREKEMHRKYKFSTNKQ